MTASVFDSRLYGHLWADETVRSWFEDRGRVEAWLAILSALAAEQAELDLIPAPAASAIAELSIEQIDLEQVAEQTRLTGHSTLGLIEVATRQLPERAREWFYYGATVQDVSDTWTALLMQRLSVRLLDDLRTLELICMELAREHRDTLMLGRTHGQPGLPITFGFKAAVWAAELRRHIDRLVAGYPRFAVCQLAGAVGTGAFFGAQGVSLRNGFARRLGLNPPDMTWLTARDPIAEFVTLLAMVTGTTAKVGNEVLQLQRPEIGEAREATSEGNVGSITMPHKRNPERSEQVGTLARVVRAAAGLSLEGLVHEHERDGTAWKTEWAFFPEACLATSAAMKLSIAILEGLEVDAARMAQNLEAQDGYVLSEPLMGRLAERIGKHTAHRLIYEAAVRGRELGVPFDVAIADSPASEVLGPEAIAAALDPAKCVRGAGELVDEVIADLTARRDEDPSWHVAAAAGSSSA
jgi:adenylosuccinate lyase